MRNDHSTVIAPVNLNFSMYSSGHLRWQFIRSLIQIF